MTPQERWKVKHVDGLGRDRLGHGDHSPMLRGVHAPRVCLSGAVTWLRQAPIGLPGCPAHPENQPGYWLSMGMLEDIKDKGGDDQSTGLWVARKPQ